MKIQTGKFDPEKNTAGQMFFRLEKEGRSWGFKSQIGGEICPKWARPKAYFAGGVSGWGRAETTIKFVLEQYKKTNWEVVFEFCPKAKEELSAEVDFVEIGAKK